MDAIQRRCLACGERFTGVSRRQKYCSHKCRPSAQNAFDGSTYRGAENPDLTASQAIENIDADLGHSPEGLEASAGQLPPTALLKSHVASQLTASKRLTGTAPPLGRLSAVG